MTKKLNSYALVTDVAALLLQRHWQCVVAESCTGGSLAAAMTEIAGSSQWFDRGYVTYSNLAKQQMLAVSSQTLEQHGAVSEATVRAMAIGAVTASGADVSVAISGIAGPGGGSPEKPVGTVWIAWAIHLQHVEAECYVFRGSRATIRQEAVLAALIGLVARVRTS